MSRTLLHRPLDAPLVIPGRNRSFSIPNVRRIAQLTCMLALALLILMWMRTPKPNHDVWHEMALARESMKLGHVPIIDLFSYAPTVTPVVDHEWLGGVIAFCAYSSANLNGFMILWFGLTSLLWAACSVGLRGTTTSVKIGATVLMIPFVMYSNFQPCLAQAYSSVLTALTLLIVQSDSSFRNRRWLLLCIPLSILWANLHGGAVIGVVILAAYALECWLTGKCWLAPLAIATAMAVAFMVTPFGLSYYPYLAHALTMPRPEIGQWKPFWFLHEMDVLSGLFVVSLCLLGWVIRRDGVFTGSIITLTLAILAARAGKNLPFYGIVWLIFAARHIPAPAISHRAVVAVGIACSAAIPALAFMDWQAAPWHVVLQSDLETTEGPLAMPVHAADYLERTGFRGNIMTFFRHGAYLSWRLYPKVKVSCDARYEAAYPTRDVDRNFEVFLRRPELFPTALDRLPQTDLILIDRRMAARKAIHDLPGWHPVYHDEIFTLLGRELPPHS